MPMTSATATPPALQTVQLDDGLTLGYRELGEGPPVLLLHGWPTSSLLWRGVMPALAERHRTVALDMPGFGGSDKPLDMRYDFADFEQAIDGFLAKLGIDRVALALHDLGGPIGVHWALGRPGRLSGLALLNTLLYPEFSPAVIEFVTALTTPDERDKLTRPEGLADVMRLGLADPEHLSVEALAGVVAPFQGDDDRLALAKAGIGLDPAGFGEIAAGLPSLDVPVCVVYGADDRILPDVAQTMARVKADIPHADVTAIEGCGHFLQEEASERVGELLAEFFGR
jgi:haloalkane dehalogenase